jgi:hypothetical protein
VATARGLGLGEGGLRARQQLIVQRIDISTWHRRAAQSRTIALEFQLSDTRTQSLELGEQIRGWRLLVWHCCVR